MSAEQAQPPQGAAIGYREMGLALSALAAAIVVSILICQFLIVVAATGGHKRPPISDKADICEPSVAVVKPARLSR